jgi:Tfp pilus assembly protein PilX
MFCSFRRRSARSRLRAEDGNALIAVILISMLVGALTSLTLASAQRADTSSASDRNHEIALGVAEAGIHDTVSRIQSDAADGTLPDWLTFDPPPVTTPQGTYDVSVERCFSPYSTTCQSLGVTDGWVIESAGSTGGTQLGRGRRVRVGLLPPKIFPHEDSKYTTFSYTDIAVKNGDRIRGDVFANHGIALEQSAIIEGSVTSATSWICMQSHVEVHGNAWAGGFHSGSDKPCKTAGLWAMDLESDVVIDGWAKASVTSPTDPSTCAGAPTSPNYDINGGTIKGDATALGIVTSSVPPGRAHPNTCTAAAPKKEIPPFEFNPDNYVPAPLPTFHSVTEFDAWVDDPANAGGKHGTFVIEEPNPSQVEGHRVDLSGWDISGDVTIVTNAPIITSGITDTLVPDGTKAKLVLVSHYQPKNPPFPYACNLDSHADESDCAIHAKNQLQPSCKTAVLLYADLGPVAVKNNGAMCGSIISSGILVQNGLQLIYDATIERTVGFGQTTYELGQWEECTPSTAADCDS